MVRRRVLSVAPVLGRGPPLPGQVRRMGRQVDMLRRLGIRAKVLAVLAVPVLVLLVTSAYISVQAVAAARTAAAVENVVTVLPAYADAAERLQQERTLSMQTVSDGDLSGNLDVARSATDKALSDLNAAVGALDISALDSRVREAMDTATNQQSRIASMRESIDSDRIPQTLVESNFSDVIEAANDVPALVAETLSQRALASRLTAYAGIADTIEQVLRAQPTALAVFEDDGADSSQVQELASLFAVQNQTRSDARAATNNLHLNGIQLPSRDADLTALQLSLVSGNQLLVSTLDTVRWNTLTNGELAALRPVAADLLDSASSEASSSASAAQREAAVTIGATALATVLSIVIAFIVSRGIVIPLRRLTSAAGEVREELPRLVEQVAVPGESPDLTLAEIPVESSDEVGRLAAAFNSVNATTIQVAREQAALRGSIAEMFVNVARRDQVLLGRQLSFIDSLERSEEDPAVLANLFRLDHLATRMRRNAESLLVLAGIDSGRRLREAMPLSDVIRTASSEIEQYDRVQLELRADPLMHGFNALAAAHLLAELLENATLFSEPGTPVVVSTGVQGDLVTVEVIDQGLGMSPEELVEANTTIAATAATDAIGAQRLGLFVVARLARRLGADVRLERAAGPHSSSGTVAVVSFPSALFTSNDPALSGPAVPASRTVSGPEAGAIPAPPVAVPVDLAALTDGATSTGLPKRRVSGEQSPVEAAAARSTMPTEQDVVLPAPTETTLAPEIAAAAAEWTPQVSATGPAALPSRSSALPTRGGGDALPSRAPVEPAAPVAPAEAAPAPSGPRSGLFAGFRGRDVLPQLTELPVPEETPAPSVLDLPLPAAAPEVAAAADPLDGYTFRSADDLAGPLTAGLDEPTSGGWHLDPDAAPVVAPVAEDEPASGPEPAVQPAAFVVPGLVPDETLDESRAWAWPGADQSVAPEQPAETMAALPVAPGWEAPSDPSAAEPAAEVWAPTEPAEWSTPGGPVVHEQPAAFAPLPAYAPPADQVPADVAPFAAEPFVAPSAEPVAAAPEPGWTAAPAAWSAEPLAPAAPVTAAPAPATPVVAGPVSAPAPDADVAPLPDFASLVQGDGSEAAPMHRPRKKRSFFSFGPGKSRRATAPTAQTAPPVVPVLPPPVAPVAPVERPAWTPSAAWMPTEDVAPAVPAPLPTPTAPAGGWAGAPVPEPSATGAAGLPVAAQVFAPADVLPETFASAPTAEPAVPSSPARAPEADLAPSGLSAWAPQQAAEDAPAPIWSAPAATGTALPTRVPAAVPPPVPEPVSDPVERTAPPRNVSAWASAWSPEGSPAAPVSSWSSDPAGAAGGAPAQRSGALDAEAASMLALRADIQEQALSELSQLSAYRPTVVDRPANGSLTRRVPTAIPAAPEITHEAGAAASRDADGLRDRLSDFQSGTRRGRRAQAGSESGEVPAPGSEPNPSEPQPSSPTW